MALTLLGPRKNLKKKESIQEYIPELQSQTNLIVSCVTA